MPAARDQLPAERVTENRGLTAGPCVLLANTQEGDQTGSTKKEMGGPGRKEGWENPGLTKGSGDRDKDPIKEANGQADANPRGKPSCSSCFQRKSDAEENHNQI